MAGAPAIQPGLSRMRVLLDRLDAPQSRLPPVVHIAGTNGKGSTVAYLRAFFEAAGLKAHAFTSPHFVSVRECVRLAGRLVDDGALAALFARVEAASDSACRPTPFEALTLAALLGFSETRADALLLESGMGGREDCVNVVESPAVAVITPISHDHLEFLGPTLADVAAHKAGVIKPGVPAVLAPQPYALAAEIIERAAKDVGAPLYASGRDWLAYADGDGMTYVSPFGARALPRPALAGAHQIANAGTAIAALEAAFPDLAKNQVIAAGLTGVRWPGRLQELPPQGGMRIWADGGHNDSAGAALADWAAEDPPVSLVVGMLAGKDVAAFLAPLAPFADRLLAVPIQRPPRPAHDPAHIAVVACGLGLNAAATDSAAAALATLRDGGARRVLVCGSLHLSPEVLPAGFMEEAP